MTTQANPWAVRKRLDRITVELELLKGGHTVLRAHGRCESKRASLWTYTERWGPSNSTLAPHDAAAHLLLVCCQDRPVTLDQLEHGLCGGVSWDEPELPW